MYIRSALLLIISLGLASCSKMGKSVLTPSSYAFPAGSPMADVIRFDYAVYLLPGHSDGAKALAVANELVRRQYKSLTPVKELPGDPGQIKSALISVHLEKDVPKNYKPPTIESLKYRGKGLSQEDGRALQKSRQAIILQFAHPKENVWTSLFSASRMVEDLARKTGGLVWDEEARQVFTPDSWHKARFESWTGGEPDLSTQFMVDLYADEGEYVRAVSLGMAKFGLPDIVVQELPNSSSSQIGNLINVFAQLMAEGAVIPASGKLRLDIHAVKNDGERNGVLKSFKAHALGTACLLLKSGKKQEGDAENRLVELSADLYSGPDPQAKQDRMLASFFGSEDEIHQVEHTQELLAESNRERAKLPELQKAFNAGLEPGEYIDVKAPFTTAKGHEWMWVEVTRWKGKTITGTLQNDPVEALDLHAGQIVQVQEDDVFDYIRYYPDKHTEGNTTGEIIHRQQTQPKSAPEHSEMPDCQ